MLSHGYLEYWRNLAGIITGSHNTSSQCIGEAGSRCGDTLYSAPLRDALRTAALQQGSGWFGALSAVRIRHQSVHVMNTRTLC